MASQRYAAFLRGIMPSNPNMKSDKLRGVFDGLGFEQVGSVLASGNIVFSSSKRSVPKLEQEIQRALSAELGIAGGTIVRTLPELDALIGTDPFAGLTHASGSYLVVTFLKDGVAPPSELPSDPDPLTKVLGFDPDARAFLTVVDNSNPGKTPDFMRWLEKSYGKDITTRTWPTVLKVVSKLDASR